MSDLSRRAFLYGTAVAAPALTLATLAVQAAEHPDAERVVIMDPAAKPGAQGHLDAAAIRAAGAQAITRPVEAWSATGQVTASATVATLATARTTRTGSRTTVTPTATPVRTTTRAARTRSAVPNRLPSVVPSETSV